MMQLSVQLSTMAAMVISGIYLGAMHDTFKRFAWHWKNRIIMKYALTISFWLMQTFIVYYVLFLVNYGDLRIYIFLACLLGYAFYQALLTKLYRYMLELLIKAVKAVYQFVFNVIKTFIYIPIRFLLQTLIICIVFLLKTMYSMFQIILKVILYPIIWLGKIVYKLLPKKMKKVFPKFAGLYSKIKNIYSKISHFLNLGRRR